MKKLFIIVVVIAMLTTMSTAGFAAENEIVASQPTPDVQQTEYTLGDINTDKNTAANRLLNLETAPEVISNLKSYTLKTNN